MTIIAPTYRRFVAFAVALTMFLPVSLAQLKVTGLKVEHMVAPTTVDAEQPRLSWINETLNKRSRGCRQTAYQIVVASSMKNLRAGRYDIWDSGKRRSSESNLITYGGKALKSGADYYWRVRTWDQAGKVSAWSEASKWGMGLLSRSDWKGRWISSDQNNGGAPLLRKGFKIRGKVKQAKVFICGLGFFELYLNGKRVGDDYLVPNLSNYTKRKHLTDPSVALKLSDNFRAYRVLYMSYDVTSQLQNGENAMGVILGNGFYNPDKAIAGYYGHPCLLLQTEITYENGTKQLVVSDDSWLTKPSAIKYNGVYQGEIYDASSETSGWASVSCSEEGWKSVQTVDGPIGVLTAQTSPGDKITEVLSPVKLKKLDDGKYEVDFGKEIAGWIRFKNIQGQRGDTLRVNYVCESPQGTQQYIYKGNAEESYAPRFTWFVFSKAVISGVKNLTESQLQAEAVNTDVKLSAEFSTSNPLFNKINEIWRRSQIDNMHGCIASDCPHRERLPYTGDGQAACATVMCNFDAAAFYQKWIRDMRDAQDKDTGYEPNSAPWQPGCGGGVAWGAAMNLMPWEYYVQYGDRKMLEDCYYAMKEQIRWMLTWLQPDGTIFQKRTNVDSSEPNYWFNLGDWCPPYGLPKDDLVHTFYLWQCADFTARAAQVLRHSVEETEYRDLADRTKKAFNDKYYDAAGKTYGDFGSNIYALVMGVPADRKADVVNSLKKEIVETHGGHINTGFLATKYFFETLTKNGLDEVAYNAMNKKDFPSFGHWIEQGATTTWEQFDGQNSRNHPMFGSGLTWFYRCLAGINADEKEPGFRHIVIRPTFSQQLDSVYYAYDTPYGKVVSDISCTQKAKRIRLTIPVGSYATLYLPVSDSKAITESGKALRQAKGVSVLQNGEQTVLKLLQGTYDFVF